MNNEEKILTLLEKLTEKVDKLETAQEEMRSAQENMRGDIAQLQETLTRVAVTQEGVVLPRIQLALEGHTAITEKLETLAPKERVEVLEDRVVTLETVVKSMSKRLAALEKAQ